MYDADYIENNPREDNWNSTLNIIKRAMQTSSPSGYILGVQKPNTGRKIVLCDSNNNNNIVLVLAEEIKCRYSSGPIIKPSDIPKQTSIEEKLRELTK